MQRSRLFLMIPAFALALTLGCSKGTDTPPPSGDTSAKKDKGKQTPKTLEPVEVKASGGIKGKVTFDGTPPEPKSLVEAIKKNEKDTDRCLAGDTNDPTWIIGPDKGVADVVVWVRPAGDKYFVVPDAKRKAEGEVAIDQPFCRFEPAVVAVYPTYFDPESKTLKPTGQKFLVKNSAPIGHNTNWSGNKRFNTGANLNIASGGMAEINAVSEEPKKAGGEDLIELKCNIHPFMTGWARVFDHPYFAISSGDVKEAKEFGMYEIKDVPAGTELEVVYWHPSFGKEVKVAKKLTVKEGATEDVPISIK
ncbi:MAG: hypothetical protein AB7K24_18630 [Gemmataceae bacterium]